MEDREVHVVPTVEGWIRVSFFKGSILVEVLEVKKLTPRFVRQIEEFVRAK